MQIYIREIGHAVHDVDQQSLAGWLSHNVMQSAISCINPNTLNEIQIKC